MLKRGKILAAILAGSTLLLLSQMSMRLHLPPYFERIFLAAGLIVTSVNVWWVIKADEMPPGSK